MASVNDALQLLSSVEVMLADSLSPDQKSNIDALTEDLQRSISIQRMKEITEVPFNERALGIAASQRLIDLEMAVQEHLYR